MQLADIPGLAEVVSAAEAEERHLRDLAFMDVPVEICGVEVQQFRPRHYRHLSLARSPFLTGGKIAMEHVLQFLWIVSPGFRVGDAPAARQFADCTLLAPGLPKLAKVRDAIFEYIRIAWMDAPPGGDSDSSPIASVDAHLVHEFGKAYGWGEERTVEMPFAKLYQLQRLIDRDAAAANGRRLAFENAISSAVERAFIQQFRKAQEAAAAAETP